MTIAMPVKGLITPQGIRAVPEKKAFAFDEEKGWVERTMREAGDLDDIDLFYGQCLVAKHIRDTIGTMKLIAAEQTRLEDKYQGKVGLLLKMGPLAFQSDQHRNFGAAMPKIGQWVMYSASDGRDADLICMDGLTHCPCRVLEDAEIKGVLRWPSRIW